MKKRNSNISDFSTDTAISSGEILRAQRHKLGMTQQQVADKAQITLQQYQKFESNSRDIRNASFQLACRVLKALKININLFFEGKVD